MVYASLHNITAACLCFYEWKVKHGWPVRYPTFHHVWPIFTNIFYVQIHRKSAEIRGAERKCHWNTWAHRRALNGRGISWWWGSRHYNLVYDVHLASLMHECYQLLSIFSRNPLVHGLDDPCGIFAQTQEVGHSSRVNNTLLKTRNWNAYKWSCTLAFCYWMPVNDKWSNFMCILKYIYKI